VDPTPDPPFEVVETHRGRVYRLPTRRIGPLRFLALVPLGFVVLSSGFLVKFYVSRAWGLPDDVFWGIFVVLLPGWAWMTYTYLDIAASFWCGRSEIEIDSDGRVRSYDRAGWFGLCLCRFRSGTPRRLLLEECSAPEQRQSSIWAWMTAGLWQLSAQGSNGRRGWLAVGYPRPILAALAEELARQLAVPLPETTDRARAEGEPATPIPAPVPVVAEPGFPNRDATEPPVRTGVALERHPKGVTLTVPRLGLSGKNIEPFCLGAFLAAIGAFQTVFLVLLPLFQGNLDFPLGLFIGPGITAAGAGLMLYWLNAGRKRVALAVVDDKLLIFETGPLGSKRREFARAELLDIACRETNVPDLLIVMQDKETVELLAGRNADELKWIATVLRQALGIPSEAPEHRRPVGHGRRVDHPRV
jgi:hypothetical protein